MHPRTQRTRGPFGPAQRAFPGRGCWVPRLLQAEANRVGRDPPDHKGQRAHPSGIEKLHPSQETSWKTPAPWAVEFLQWSPAQDCPVGLAAHPFLLHSRYVTWMGIKRQKPMDLPLRGGWSGQSALLGAGSSHQSLSCGSCCALTWDHLAGVFCIIHM